MIRNIFKRIVHIYHKTYILLVIYPIVTYLITLLLFNIMINIYLFMTNNVEVSNNHYITNYTLLKLPSIDCINNFFKYKCHNLRLNYKLLEPSNLLFTHFPSSTNEQTIPMLDLSTLAEITRLHSKFSPYTPTLTPTVSPTVSPKEPFSSIPTKDEPRIRNIFPENYVPKFEITPANIDETIVAPPPIIINDLPFEAPVIITVDDSPLPTIAEIVLINNTNVLTDIGQAICSPSYEGKRINDDDQIFQLHLDIVENIKRKLSLIDVVDRHGVQQMIRTTTSSYLHAHFAQMTVKDLSNVNFIINLLVKELLINSIFVFADDERLIMREIIIALIVESLSIVQKMDPNTYYSDLHMMQMIVNTIIPRFNVNWDWTNESNLFLSFSIIKLIKIIYTKIRYYRTYLILGVLILYFCSVILNFFFPPDIILSQIIQQLTEYELASQRDEKYFSIISRLRYIQTLYPIIKDTETLSHIFIQKYISQYNKLTLLGQQTLVNYLSVLDFYQLQKLDPLLYDEDRIISILADKQAEISKDLTESLHKYKVEKNSSNLYLIPIVCSIVIVSVAGFKYLSGF